jgi:ribosomal protein L6P/L9E
METPGEVSELVEFLKKGGFEVSLNDNLITVKGQPGLLHRKGDTLYIEVDDRNLKLIYVENGNKTSITLLKFRKILKEAEGVKVTEYDVLKVMDFDRRFEVFVDTDAFGIRY